MDTKICNKCGEEKSIDLYRKQRNACRDCRQKEHKLWTQKNKDRLNKKRKEKYQIDSSLKLKQNKKWRDQNKNTLNSSRRKRYCEDEDYKNQITNRTKKYRNQNKTQLNSKKKEDIQELKNWYLIGEVRRLGFKDKEITQEILDLKKAEILITRIKKLLK